MVHALDEADSTQGVLADLARLGAPEGTVVTARHQTGGRGRRGRRWWDAPGQSVLMSVLLRPQIPAAHAPQLSLVAGLAVADALDVAASIDARIRWPNDVLVNGRKICGILPDAVSGTDGRIERIVLGIGLNVGQTAFPDDLAPIATSIRLEAGVDLDPTRVQAAVLEALDRQYRDWLDHGFAALRPAWRRRSSTIGTRVRLAGGGEGVAVDVEPDGALLVEVGAGVTERVISGEAAAGER